MSLIKSFFSQPPEATLIIRPEQLGRGDDLSLIVRIQARSACDIDHVEAVLLCQRTTPDPTHPRSLATETLHTHSTLLTRAFSIPANDSRTVEGKVQIPLDAMHTEEFGGYKILWGVAVLIHLKRKGEPVKVTGHFKVLDMDPTKRAKKRPSIREALDKLKERQDSGVSRPSLSGSARSSAARPPAPAPAPPPASTSGVRPAPPRTASGAAPPRAAAPLPPLPDAEEVPGDVLPKGTVLNYKYEIIDRLGQGGMGVVYKGMELGPNRTVALKVLSPALLSDEEATKRFFREAETYFALKHPNIVHLIDTGFDHGVHYIAMEFVQGKDLMEWALEDAQGLPDLLEKLKDVVRGLAHAHGSGIIHRDLKPENIMITTDGRVKVMDFGLARKLEETTRLTKTGTVMGTVVYMPPEQATGGKVDEKSDIYSLGCMIYELCTGSVPFDTDDPIAAIFKHVSEAPRPPRELNPHIPEALEAIILRCLEKAKEDRFNSADDLLTALEAVKL